MDHLLEHFRDKARQLEYEVKLLQIRIIELENELERMQEQMDK